MEQGVETAGVVYGLLEPHHPPLIARLEGHRSSRCLRRNPLLVIFRRGEDKKEDVYWAWNEQQYIDIQRPYIMNSRCLDTPRPYMRSLKTFGSDSRAIKCLLYSMMCSNLSRHIHKKKSGGLEGSLLSHTSGQGVYRSVLGKGIDALLLSHY